MESLLPWQLLLPLPQSKAGKERGARRVEGKLKQGWIKPGSGHICLGTRFRKRARGKRMKGLGRTNTDWWRSREMRRCRRKVKLVPQPRPTSSQGSGFCQWTTMRIYSCVPCFYAEEKEQRRRRRGNPILLGGWPWQTAAGVSRHSCNTVKNDSGSGPSEVWG